MARATKAEPGSVSHGTLRPQDLIEAFVGALKETDPAALKGVRAYFEALDDHGALTTVQRDFVFDALDEKGIDGDGVHDAGPEVVNEVLDRLTDALQTVAPEGHYFGAREGNNSDFGFWPALSDDDEGDDDDEA